MKKNFLLTAISIGSRLSTSFVLFVIFARFWGPVDFGVFSFVFSVSALLVLIVEFGLQSYLLREIAATPSDSPELIRSALWAKLIFVPFFALLSLAVFFVLDRGAPADIAVPLSFAAVALSFADFFIAPLRALGRYDLETYIIIGANSFQLLVAALCVWKGGAPVELAWVLVFTRGVQLAVSYAVLRRQVPDLRLSFPGASRLRESVRRAMPYGLDGLLTTAWVQIDIVLVRLIFGPQIVGLYAAGQRIVQAASSIAPVIGNVMIPRLAQSSTQREDNWHRDGKFCIAAMGLVGFVFSIPMIFYPELIAITLFGQSYIGLADIFPFFGVLVLVRFLASAVGILLTGAGMQGQRIGVQILSLLVFLVGAAFTAAFGLSLGFLIGVMIFCFALIGVGYWWKLSRAGYAPV